jgi:cobalt-zinc-cadmium efflux system membrane fusion protein
MNGRSLLSGALFVVLGVAAGAATWWVLNLSPAGAKKAAAPLPSSVPKVFKEDQANVVTLTAEAVKSERIQTAKVERKPMRQSRVYGGEVTVPAGQTIIVTAPVGGSLSAPKGGVPKPGSVVKKGDVIFSLAPLLTPEGRVSLATAKVDAEGQVESAQATYDGAKIALDRAKRLLRSEAGSRKAVEDAQTAYDVAKKILDAATSRRAMLQKVAAHPDKETASPLTIEAPDSGVLRNVSALPGQNVHGGASLFEVINLDHVWVRVPVYVGEVGAVDADVAASVFALNSRPGTAGQSAEPTKAPPSANAAAGTVDLFYTMSNAHGYSPGQRIGVSLTLKGEADSLTVPWAAVLFDVYGGAWVYEKTGERTFARQRVVVQYVRDGTAVLRSGPKVGTTVVTAGPAELFGAETGFSK